MSAKSQIFGVIVSYRHDLLRRIPVARSATAEDAALAAIVRSSQDAVIAKTVTGIVTAWNDGAVHIYGHTAGQMVGQSIERMIPPDRLLEERARHLRVAEGTAESGYRCQRLRVDGGTIEVVMSMSPVRNAKGQVIGLASLSRPISDQEEADSRFAALLEAAPDAMLCIDAEGRITMVNAQVSRVLGYQRDELIGAPLELLVPEEARQRHESHRAGFIQDPRARPMGLGASLFARHRDGSTIPVEVSLASDTRAGGTIMIAALRDVSAQRALAASVQATETQLRQLAEHIDTVFVLRQLDPNAYLYISAGFEQLTGRDPAELIGNPDMTMELVHPEDRARVDHDYIQASRAGAAATSEHRIVRADGAVRWVRVIATPVPNPGVRASGPWSP